MPKTPPMKLESPVRILPSTPVSSPRAGRGGQPERNRRLPRRLADFTSWNGIGLGAQSRLDSPVKGGTISQIACQTSCPRAATKEQRTIVDKENIPAGRATRVDSRRIQAEQRIEALNQTVSRLTSREQRLRKTLETKTEQLKDAKGEAQEALTQAVLAEERIEKMEGLLETLRAELARYKGWWLTEYHSMKVILELLPDPDCVHDIAESSKARFRVHTSSMPALSRT